MEKNLSNGQDGKLTEKNLFSERLIQSLKQHSYSTGPTSLAKEFNLRYTGTSISVQTAYNWLNGQAIPNQDKLLVLSIWLQVSADWLRFGEVNHQKDVINISSIDKKFNQLNSTQKSLIESLIDQLIHPN